MSNYVTHSLQPLGGIGNQMFQAACAVGYSFKHNKIPKFNFLKAEHQENKNYIDYIFRNLQEGIVEQGERFYEEQNGKYREIPFFESSVILHGYYQCPNYFVDKDSIIKLFSCPQQLNLKIIETHGHFLNKNCVSIHIRRGDSIAESQLPYHTNLNIRYYKKALSLIKNIDYVFCFSDDIDWCKKNLNFKKIIFVEKNSACEDLYLMSMCKHNIIANSSFSWWAAFLNVNKNKKVIYPLNWFGPKSKSTIQDMLPIEWEGI